MSDVLPLERSYAWEPFYEDNDINVFRVYGSYTARLHSVYQPSLQLLINKQPGHPLSCPDAHTSQQDLFLLSSALAQPGADLSCACSSQRMAESDGASPDVHLCRVNAQDVGTIYCHGSERFINLNNVDVGGEVQVVFPEDFGDGQGRANTHYPRGDAGDCRADKFGEDGLVQLLGAGTLHEQHSCGCM